MWEVVFPSCVGQHAARRPLREAIDAANVDRFFAMWDCFHVPPPGIPLPPPVVPYC